jgi:hypothetical protein
LWKSILSKIQLRHDSTQVDTNTDTDTDTDTEMNFESVEKDRDQLVALIESLMQMNIDDVNAAISPKVITKS